MRFGRQAFLVLVFSVLSSIASASTYDSIYAFGDSLSDVGNILTATSVPGSPIPKEPVAPYANGQFSNGPVWLQTLAARDGIAPLTASLVGGTDYAYGDAQTGTTLFNVATPIDLTGSLGQIAQFQAAHTTADPKALYTIWIGSNDILSIPAGSSPAVIAADYALALKNIDSAITTLSGLGAKNFLVVGVPDLGLTPRAVAAGPATAATASALAQSFDAGLVGGLGGVTPSLAGLATTDGVSISYLNSYALLDNVVANPAAFGFTNTTQPCFTGTYSGGPASGTVCGTPNQYVFWDQIHPTAASHALIGDAAASEVLDPVPEPGSLVLIASGLACLCFVGRRKRGG